MANTNLSINRKINLSISLAQKGAQTQNISQLLVLGNSDVIDVVERLRTYPSDTAVALDYGTAAPEYLTAVEWFGQEPQPTSLMIGRWAQTATAAKLMGAVISTANQALATWTAITAGSFEITVNGTLKTLSGLNFSAATNLNGVAADITAALAGAATVVWNSTYQQFSLESATTGTASTLTFASPTGSGTDISSLLGFAATSSGAYIAQGIAAETAAAAVTLFDNSFGQQWYGLNMPTAVDADHLNVAMLIEGTTNKHVYGVTTQEGGVLVPTDTTDIAYQLQQLNYSRTFVQYSSSSAYAVASMFGRILTTDYSANNTVITLAYKQEPGVVPETLTETQADSLEAKNCNVFLEYNNNTAIIENGVMCSGEFIDNIIGADVFGLQLQTAAWNLLYSSPTKIPQTNAGNHLFVVTLEGICQQFVNNGYLAPGTWNSQGFGALNQGDFMPTGYYVYAPNISSQTQASRAVRQSVPFQIAGKLAGAIQDVDLLITINQ